MLEDGADHLLLPRAPCLEEISNTVGRAHPLINLVIAFLPPLTRHRQIPAHMQPAAAFVLVWFVSFRPRRLWVCFARVRRFSLPTSLHPP